MPVFVDPNGKIAYPTERCVRCQNLLMRAPGLVCDMCLYNAGEHADQQPVKDWSNWGVFPRK